MKIVEEEGLIEDFWDAYSDHVALCRDDVFIATIGLSQPFETAFPSARARAWPFCDIAKSVDFRASYILSPRWSIFAKWLDVLRRDGAMGSNFR